MDTQHGHKRSYNSADKVTVPNSKFKNSAKTFSCNFCGYTTNHKGSLTRHIRVHTREKPHKCQHPNCEAAFTIKSDLQRHQLVHNKGDENLLKFKCSSCPYKTCHKSSLAQHLKTHADVKEFACDLCPYRAKFRTNIKTHHKNVHSTERLFKCPHPGCQYSCKSKCDLNIHLRVHSSEQPFVCSLENCDFKSKWKKCLTNHEMAHRGEKPFKCSFCTFSSTKKSDLVAHSRVHTGETPFPCKNCSYRAQTCSTLSRHIKNVHGDRKQDDGAFVIGQ